MQVDELIGVWRNGQVEGVSDAAILDILTGKFKPSGKLPFALAKNAKAIAKQDPDAPGYDKADTLFPFGHGLSY